MLQRSVAYFWPPPLGLPILCRHPSKFNIEVTVGNLSDPARHRRVLVMVDTESTYTTLPREIVEDLGCRPIGSRQVVLAGGREDERPIAAVRGGHARGVRARRRSRRQATRARPQLSRVATLAPAS